MNVGKYSFEEFKQLAASFHGSPDPGLLVGGFLLTAARAALSGGFAETGPEDSGFEALAETPQALPDAIQLLTPCTIGNGRLKIEDLGKLALVLYDQKSGKGFRARVAHEKFYLWPELEAWYFKRKSAAELDLERLFLEIEHAGTVLAHLSEIRMNQPRPLPAAGSRIVVCPICGEAYPKKDGRACLYCQSPAYGKPYLLCQDSGCGE